MTQLATQDPAAIGGSLLEEIDRKEREQSQAEVSQGHQLLELIDRKQTEQQQAVASQAQSAVKLGHQLLEEIDRKQAAAGAVSAVPVTERPEQERRAIEQARGDDLFQRARETEIASGQFTNTPLRRFNQIRRDLGLPEAESLPSETVADTSDRAVNAVKQVLVGFTQTVNRAVEGVGDLVDAVTELVGIEFEPPSEFFESARNVVRAFLPDDPRLREEFLSSQLPAAIGGSAPFFLAGGLPGAIALGAAAGAQEQAETARGAGAEGRQKALAIALGGALGTTEAVLPMRLGKVLKPVDRALRGKLFSVIVNWGGLPIDVVIESLQEFGQQAGSNLIAKHVLNIDRPLMEGLVESAEVGGGVGLFYGGLFRLAGLRVPRFKSLEAQKGARRGAQVVSAQARVPPTEQRPLTSEVVAQAAQLVRERPDAAQRLVEAAARAVEAKGPRGVPSKTDFDAEGLTGLKNRDERREFIQAVREEVDRASEVRGDQGPVREPSPREPELREDQAAVVREAAAPEARKPVEPPAPQPPTGAGKQSFTSLQNAVVDRERAELGLRPAMEEARRSGQQVWDEAMAVIEADPAEQDALVFELAKKPRPTTPIETMLLLHRQISLWHKYVMLEREHAAAVKAGDTAALAGIDAHQEMLLAERLQLYDIGKAAGREHAIAFNLRKMLASEEFTLLGMISMKRKAKGVDELSKEDTASLTKTSRRIAELEARLAEHAERITQLEADQASVEAVKEIVASEGKRPRKKRTAAAKAELDKAWKDFEDQVSGKLFANPLDPALIASAVRLAKAHVNVGIATFQDFIEAVRGRIGKDKTERAREALRRAWDSAVSEDIPRPQKSLKTPEVVSRFARKLAKYFVSTGVTERDALINAVHGELVKVVPEITRRQSMDAVSGYGQYSPLSQETLDVLLRDLKGQMQQIAKLEDMQAGQAPLKTGQERRAPSDEERHLIQQVNQMKKHGGFDITDPATQLQSALAAVKTRLRNQITDLEHQIATKEKTVRERTKVPQDKEVQRLTERRDALKEQFDGIFGKPELTDEQRVKAATAAAKRSIAEYERRIRERDFTSKRPSKLEITTELQAFRDRRDALKAELKELRDLVSPRKTPQERALSALKSRLRTRIADYQDRLARKDFAPKVRKKTPLDEEAEKLRYEAETLKAKFLQELEQDRLRRRAPVQKILGTLPQTANLARAILVSYDVSAVGRQGGLVVFGNPIKGIEPIGRMFRSLRSKAAASRVMNEIEKRENAALYARSGLELMELDGRLSKREEQYLGRWSKYVPGVPASERAFVTYLNLLRADLFDAMAASVSRGGTITEADAKVIATYVNVATGRGGIAEFQRAARFLATFFWSPRLALSRFQYLAGGIAAPARLLVPGQDVSRRTRMVIAREYAKTLTGITIFFATATAALTALLGPPSDDEDGWNIELNPRSSDFMRIRIKDTRIRPMAGLSQSTVLLTRLYTGEMKQLGTGEVVPIRGEEVPFGRSTGAAVVGRYLRNKLAPVVGTGLNVLAGKNVVGEQVTPKTVARDLTIPLSFREIGILMKEHGVPAALTLQMLESFGMGVQNYDDMSRKSTPTRKEAFRQLGRAGYAATSPSASDRAQLRAIKAFGDARLTEVLRAFDSYSNERVDGRRRLKVNGKAYNRRKLRLLRLYRKAKRWRKAA